MFSSRLSVFAYCSLTIISSVYVFFYLQVSIVSKIEAVNALQEEIRSLTKIAERLARCSCEVPTGMYPNQKGILNGFCAKAETKVI